MDLGISGKTALVTGGIQGIGQSITNNLLNEGVQVLATSRSKIAIEKSKDRILKNKGKFIPIHCDVSNESQLEQFLDLITNEGYEIDILVNNAGHTLDIKDPYCAIEDWRSVMHLNFEVPLTLSNHFIPEMKKKEWGRIVNITSCAGLENSGPVTFSVAKAALTAYTRSMGRVLATETQNVVMSAVFPGVVLTEGGHWEQVLRENPDHATKYLNERCPLGRFGQIDEIGPIVAIYCSNLASFSHGAIIPVDAGQSKHFMYFNYLD